jgi:DNA-binding NarL/FixJ family response regulator
MHIRADFDPRLGSDLASAAEPPEPRTSRPLVRLRVLLVGPAAERVRLRARAEEAFVTVVGEVESTAAADRFAGAADAWLVAAPDPRLGRRRRAAGDDAAIEALTPREHQVLELLAEGLPNKAIASRLGISDQTVKFHVAAVTGKLAAANRTDAVRRAVRRGLLAL